MIDAGALTADFAAGNEYRLAADREGGRWVIEDAAQRLVAELPVGLGGEVRTRTDRWVIRPESRRIGWAVVARNLSDKTEAARVRESLLPYTWKLRVAPDFDFRVTGNPVRGHWTLSHGGWRLVRISDVGDFSTGRLISAPGRGSAGTIRTLDAPPRLLPLPLAILLTLQMIVADAAIPHADSSGGG
jgi:hypothetical protein